MNYKVVLYIIGLLLILTGIFMMLGIPFSIYYGSNDILYLVISGFITIFCGLILFLLFRKGDTKNIGKREGYLIVSLGWFIMSIFGSLPFIISGTIPSFVDAFFETMSGFTTTGATILIDIESVMPGILFWRSLTQWLGEWVLSCFHLQFYRC